MNSRANKPTKLTPKVAMAICESVRRGNYLATAAAAAGVSRGAVYQWKGRAESGEEPFASFAAELERAQAEAEESAVAIIRKAAFDDWKAAKFWLERAIPQRWGEMLAKQGPEDDGKRPVIHVHMNDLEAAEAEERKRLHGGNHEQATTIESGTDTDANDDE